MQKRILLPCLLLFSLGSSTPQPAQPGTPPAGETPTLRLPTTARPTGYAIHLDLVPGADSYGGDVDIDLKLEAPGAVLWLNGSPDLMIESARLSQAPRPDAVPSEVSQVGADFIGLRFAAPL